jgi:hypothetical protein
MCSVIKCCGVRGVTVESFSCSREQPKGLKNRML